jgi:ferrous iron transport protein B
MERRPPEITVALVGNPNSGKTTLFNLLTGSRQHVANYPGVTIEKKEGLCDHGDTRITFVDLPGTYSLTAYSQEEAVTRDFILHEHPDVVVDVIDASNVERHLYLTTHLMEMGVPLVLAFNMADVAEAKGLVFDLESLSILLGSPIVRTVGSAGEGKRELLNAIVQTAGSSRLPAVRPQVHYGQEIEQELAILEKGLSEKGLSEDRPDGTRWIAVKLLEQDPQVTSQVGDAGLRPVLEASLARLRAFFHEEPSLVMADRRYGFISGACQETIQNTAELRHDVSDLIDSIVTHRLLGLPIFLGLMYGVFWLTFGLGRYPMAWLEGFFRWTGREIAGSWPSGSAAWAKSLLVDGVISGVGGVVVFLPTILLLFLAIAVLEDSGYMARAAFVMDHLMHKIGLHGKSFIPMLLGFGCSVPAIMATRILEDRRNRLTTLMVIPLMSCGARLTIYMLIIPAFFPQTWQGPMLWLIYLIGIVLAVVCARFLRMTVFRGETTPFVMELPPYRAPTLKSILIHTGQRGGLYLKKAGTVILGISILLWALASFPRPPVHLLAGLSEAQVRQQQLEYSTIGRLGRWMEPAIQPLGFDWRIGTALIGATAAKEVFVTQLAVVHTVGTSDPSVSLRQHLQHDYTPLTGFCILLFCLVATPCIGTVAVTRLEAGGWRWAAFQYVGLTALAYVLTLVVYQVGRLV